MKFYVRSNLSDIDYKNTNSIYLIKDSWDDWFTYNTMYSLQYITRTGDRTSVGRLKIGEHPMKDGQRSANIPSEFSILPDNFFSVGQSASYYENLNLFVPSKTKIEILTSLNDIAYETTYLDKFIDTPVLRDSLLRDIPIKTVRNQFYRIITGGAKLTSYNFSYKSGYKYDKDESMLLTFEVNPESNPPTNIHIIIGRNNVGKTHLIRSMIHKIIDKNSNDEQDGVFDNSDTEISNIVLVSFSAFDHFEKLKPYINNEENEIPLTYIGLLSYDNDTLTQKTHTDLQEDFVNSLITCLFGPKSFLWLETINHLKSDPIFASSDIHILYENADELKKDYADSTALNKKILRDKFKENARKVFSNLSSGHSIILLTITTLVEKVEEQTLVFLDEPESHLHPPLFSAFTRALSNLLTNRNGVAIVATHSPVILQEVPKKCVWKLRRQNRYSFAERLNIECFGENIGILTSEVFGLEVTESGFHMLLKEAVEKYNDYDRILEHFDHQIGMEGRAILKALLSQRRV